MSDTQPNPTHEAVQLREQLAAEREKVRILEDSVNDFTRSNGALTTEVLQLSQQLAAATRNASAWRLTAQGKEAAYVKMEQQLAEMIELLETILAFPATVTPEQIESLLANMKEGKMTLERTLEAAYKNHRWEIERLGKDYTRELNAKLEQINAQAKTMRMLVDALKLLDGEGPLVDYRAIARTALEKVIPYPLPIGRTK